MKVTCQISTVLKLHDRLTSWPYDFQTSQIQFQIGEAFDETTADGREVKSLMTLEKPNIIKHEMKVPFGVLHDY